MTIAVKDVTLARNGRTVLHQLNLTMDERRIGLVGVNGAGKSSLLRLLNGLLLPDQGQVIVHGLETQASRAQLPGSVGFIFQNPEHQIVFPTSLEEIAFGLRERGLDAKAATSAARDFLKLHNCADWCERAVAELSDGQKQHLCILAVLVCEPALIVLDEPFSSLDLRARNMFLRLLASLPQQIVMASHDLDAMRDFDRIIWLDDGRVAGDGSPDTVLRAYRAHCDAQAAP
ncbi:MAG: cobalt ABC transporter [Rhizobiales bacterium 62-17]|nr:ABC transporter ATP-binding protein [Hyphomicrobiales bacterium]OJY00022.1 MAG: cobalt ABC transporter [Rhizobiales bacterium 62-17]